MIIKNYRVNVLCPKYNRILEVSVIYAKIDNEYEPISCNGCDFGYNGSDECKECISKILNDLKDISLHL